MARRYSAISGQSCTYQVLPSHGVVGDVHTNSIEGVWSLFKRSIMGSFHKVSAKHLDRYLAELEWRFNNRKNSRIFVDALRRIVRTDTLTYAELVA